MFWKKIICTQVVRFLFLWMLNVYIMCCILFCGCVLAVWKDKFIHTDIGKFSLIQRKSHKINAQDPRIWGLFQLEKALSSIDRKWLYVINLNFFVWRHECHRFLLKFWLKQIFPCLTPNWNSPLMIIAYNNHFYVIFFRRYFVVRVGNRINGKTWCFRVCR